MLEISTPHSSKSASKITNNNYRDHLKKEGQERKKIILHLILKYFVENNLHSCADQLRNETQTGTQYQVCDNIDLDIVLQEFQSYYLTKFQKPPKIIKKMENNEQVVQPFKSKEKKKEKKIEKPIVVEKKEEQFQFEIVNLTRNLSLDDLELDKKNLANFENYSSEWREMADQIIKQIIPKTLGISFQDCISLTETIERLKEAIIYPLEYPELFENVRSWKGILLYGPPGTGKTLLAKAVACESRTTFINVTSSAFISKWRGESEKLVKVLFDIAKMYAPATIFIDEIDALASNSHDSLHEASRRFKSELLTQIDGIVQSEEIFILATSNTPWTIDAALLRRFEKRILVPLPQTNARYELFQHYFSKNGESFKSEQIQSFVKQTENFSGSDLKNLCKEVEMIVIREKLQELKKGHKKSLTARKASVGDVMNALQKIKPSSDINYYRKYNEWGEKYGAA